MFDIVSSILHIIEDVTFGVVGAVLLVMGTFFWWEYRNWSKK
jgi:hypothetical protein